MLYHLFQKDTLSKELQLLYLLYPSGTGGTAIPEGYSEQGAATTVSPVSPVNVGSSEDNDDATNDVNNFIGYDNLSPDQIAKFTGQIYGTTGSFLSVIPTIGFALKKQKEQFIEAAERISKDPTVTSAIREAYANALAITKLPPNQQKAASKKFADTVKGNKVATWFGPWSYKAQLDTERKSKGVNTLQGLMKEEDIQPTIDDALAKDEISDDYAYDPDDTYDYRKDPAWIADNKAKEEAAAKAAKEKEAEDNRQSDREMGGPQTQEEEDFDESGGAYNKGGLASRKKKK